MSTLTSNNEDYYHHCHQCGNKFFENSNGVSNHTDETDLDGIDYDLDLDHVPYEL